MFCFSSRCKTLKNQRRNLNVEFVAVLQLQKILSFILVNAKVLPLCFLAFCVSLLSDICFGGFLFGVLRSVLCRSFPIVITLSTSLPHDNHSGSIRYIHQTCLQHWLSLHPDSTSCELCHFPFQFQPIYRGDRPERLPSSEVLSSLVKRAAASIPSLIRATVVDSEGQCDEFMDA